MLVTETKEVLEKGLAPDQTIFLAKQQKKKKKVAPVQKPKQGGKKK